MFYASDITRLSNGRSFMASSENPTGAPGGGSRGNHLQKLSASIRIPVGETLTLLDIDGPGEVQSMWFGSRMRWDDIIRIYWDNQEYPSVEVPGCAFFGYPFFENVLDVNGQFPTLNSAVVLNSPCRGFNCYWKMPFKKHCKITLENRHPVQDGGTHYAITGELKEVPDDAVYFCASYRQARPVPQNREYVAIDGIRGKGHFVGLSLGIGLGGENSCWTEGEPKMYIDGEQYPSINYTGMEDYFCGSYNFGDDDRKMGFHQTYSGHYAGMYAMLGSNRTEPHHTSRMIMPRFMLYRWHLPDPIRFNTEFKMTLQSLNLYSEYGARVRHDDYITVAYWYQTLPTAPLAPLPSPIECDLT